MTDLLRLSVPLTVWLAGFSAIYGLQGLTCSDRWTEAGLGPEAARWALVLVGLLGVALQVVFLLVLRNPRLAARSSFIQGVSVVLAVVALVAMIWTLVPVVTTTRCH